MKEHCALGVNLVYHILYFLACLQLLFLFLKSIDNRLKMYFTQLKKLNNNSDVK